MANAWYATAKQALAAAQVNWVSATIKAQLVDTAAYTVNLTTHQYLSDIPSGARIGTAVALTNKTNVLGVLDADDVSITGLTSAPTIEAVVLFVDTGTPATSQLLVYIDTATGLPTVANATQADIQWPSGAGKIAAI